MGIMRSLKDVFSSNKAKGAALAVTGAGMMLPDSFRVAAGDVSGFQSPLFQSGLGMFGTGMAMIAAPSSRSQSQPQNQQQYVLVPVRDT